MTVAVLRAALAAACADVQHATDAAIRARQLRHRIQQMGATP